MPATMEIGAGRSVSPGGSRASRRARGPWTITGWAVAAEGLVAAALLAAASIGGLVLARRPGPDRFDLRGDAALPVDPTSRLFHDLALLGSLPVLLVGAGVLVVAGVGVARDWVRGVACAAGALLAVAVVQEIAKPLVDRQTVSGMPSYPSGTVTAVAALATGAVLVAPRVLRPIVLLLTGAAVVGVGIAVVALRWHYPTDVVGGVCVGVGAVLALDALAHVPWLIGRARRRW